MTLRRYLVLGYLTLLSTAAQATYPRYYPISTQKESVRGFYLTGHLNNDISDRGKNIKKIFQNKQKPNQETKPEKFNGNRGLRISKKYNPKKSEPTQSTKTSDSVEVFNIAGISSRTGTGFQINRYIAAESGILRLSPAHFRTKSYTLSLTTHILDLSLKGTLPLSSIGLLQGRIKKQPIYFSATIGSALVLQSLETTYKGVSTPELMRDWEPALRGVVSIGYQIRNFHIEASWAYMHVKRMPELIHNQKFTKQPYSVHSIGVNIIYRFSSL